MTAFDQSALLRLQDAAPGWRRSTMEDGFQAFSSLDEPTDALEDWKYVDLDISFADLTPVEAPGPKTEPGPFISALPDVAAHAVIVDGTVIEAGSEWFKRWSDTVQGSLSVAPDRNKLAAAHSAFAHDGLVIDVPANRVLEAPLLVEMQGSTPGTASFPDLTVNLGENSEASVAVVYRSAPGVRLLMVPDINLNVGRGANLRFLSVQNLDQAATVVVHQKVSLERDATVRIGEVGLGAHFGRLDLILEMLGDGSSAHTVGLYFGEGEQTLDYRMVIQHVGKNTSSDVLLKGAVEDSAQSVFTGLIRIEKDAVRTSTFETNAKAHSVPNLEILCDDVVCGHGSSVGPLEEENLYYLQSRGLSRPRAERLLVKGFFQEVIDRLPIQGMEGPIAAEVFRRFVAAQEEGRVA